MSRPGFRLRQVVFATRRLDTVVAGLQARLGLSVSHRSDGQGAHAEFGLRAAMLPVGEQFIEIIEPRGDDVPAARHLRRLGHDGGYMVILQTSSLAAAKARLAELGVRIVWEGGAGVRAVHLHPHDIGGALLSLAQATPPDTWAQGGADWPSHVRTDVVTEILEASIACADPQRTARVWGEVLGREAAGGDEPILRLDQGQLRFIAARGAQHGPAGVTLQGRSGRLFRFVGPDLHVVTELADEGGPAGRNVAT